MQSLHAHRIKGAIEKVVDAHEVYTSDTVPPPNSYRFSLYLRKDQCSNSTTHKMHATQGKLGLKGTRLT